jgi:hypothetical protein
MCATIVARCPCGNLKQKVGAGGTPPISRSDSAVVIFPESLTH